LVPAVGQFRAERGLLVKDGVPVAPAGDQPGVVQRGQVLGHGARGAAVAAGQGVRGGRFGE
jgi:hypothetical protein